MEGILKDNGKTVTSDMEVFMTSKGLCTVRISDFAEYPEQQGMFVLADVLLAVGIVDDRRNVKIFINRNMINKRDDFGQKLYDICEVPSGHSSVSPFQNFCFCTTIFTFSIFGCFWYKKSSHTMYDWIFVLKN